jgi:hypothetical protein
VRYANKSNIGGYMKIFFSWSGEKSHAVAEAFSEWLPCVIQAVTPWFSSKDIDRGSVWINEIFEQLKDTNFGVVFVTQENQSKPWVLFEAGALSKGLKENRICTVLVDLHVRDVEAGSPLLNLNHTEMNKKNILALIKTINKTMELGNVQDKHLEFAFDSMWPTLEKNLQDIETRLPQTEPKERQDNDVLNDILNSVLSIDKKVSRGHRTPMDSVLPRKHAEVIFKKLLNTGIEQDGITDILDDLVPTNWLKNQIKQTFEIDDG